MAYYWVIVVDVIAVLMQLPYYSSALALVYSYRGYEGFKSMRCSLEVPLVLLFHKDSNIFLENLLPPSLSSQPIITRTTQSPKLEYNQAKCSRDS